MSPNFLDEISKLTKLEKLELARYLLDELIKDEREEEFELSDEQKAELDRRWAEIEDGTAELFTGEQISEELKEPGINTIITVRSHYLA